MVKCPAYQAGVDVCKQCRWDGDHCPNWTPWGHTFDTVRADPATMAAIAITKEVERVAKLRQAATDKGKTSKAAVQVDKIVQKFKLDRDTVLQAVGDVMIGAGVEQVAKLFCETSLETP